MLESLIKEGGEFLLSLIALLVACLKGNTKKLKTAEEIEAKEETKKQKRIAKQLKKNGITPKEEQKLNNEVIENVIETDKTIIGTIKIPKVEEGE